MQRTGTMPLLYRLTALPRPMPVGWRDVDRQWEAVFIDREMGLFFLPPSKPRSKQLGAERHERLSMMTALGSAVSPQACRQARINWLSSRRHRPSRVHRANSVYSVPNGMSQSCPIARHCRPQNATHQIARPCAAPLRSTAASARGVLTECHLPPWPRVPPVPRRRRHRDQMKASHEAGDVLASVKAVPICCWSDGCWR